MPIRTLRGTSCPARGFADIGILVISVFCKPSRMPFYRDIEFLFGIFDNSLGLLENKPSRRPRSMLQHVFDEAVQHPLSDMVTGKGILKDIVMYVVDSVEEIAFEVKNVFTLTTPFSLDLHASLTSVFDNFFPAAMSPN